MLLVVLPISTVWRLQLQRIEQVAVAICFILGLAYVGETPPGIVGFLMLLFPQS
jgi:hypothetical protein